MKRAVIFLATMAVALPAAAQTPQPQTNAGGTATVQSHMKSLGYKDIHDLRQTPDGQWTGKATQNGVQRNVTVQPNGTTTAR
jgi:hypothetical protein